MYAWEVDHIKRVADGGCAGDGGGWHGGGATIVGAGGDTGGGASAGGGGSWAAARGARLEKESRRTIELAVALPKLRLRTIMCV